MITGRAGALALLGLAAGLGTGALVPLLAPELGGPAQASALVAATGLGLGAIAAARAGARVVAADLVMVAGGSGLGALVAAHLVLPALGGPAALAGAIPPLVAASLATRRCWRSEDAGASPARTAGAPFGGSGAPRTEQWAGAAPGLAFGAGASLAVGTSATAHALSLVTGAPPWALPQAFAALAFGFAFGARRAIKASPATPGPAAVRALLAAAAAMLVAGPMLHLAPGGLAAVRGMLGGAVLGYPLWQAAQGLVALSQLAPAAAAVANVAVHLATPTATPSYSRAPGGVIGALGAGAALGIAICPLAWPLIGAWSLNLLAAALASALGLALAWHGETGVGVPTVGGRGGLLVGLAVLVLASSGLGGAWELSRMSLGLSRPADGRSWAERRAEVGKGRALFYAADVEADVTVFQRAGGAELVVDGRRDAEAGGGPVTARLASHLALLRHAAPRDVLLLGLGSGHAAGAALSHPIAALDVVEPVVALPTAHAFLASAVGAALDDPRTTVYLADGVAYLARGDRSWDVIVGAPARAWIAGDARALTREHFRDVAAALRPGGVFATWLPMAELGDDGLGLVARAASEVFPAAALWQGAQGDLILLAAAPGASFSHQDWPARVARPSVAADLAGIGVGGPLALLSAQLNPEGTLSAAIGPGPSSTRWRPAVAAAAAWQQYAGAPVTWPAHLDGRPAALTFGAASSHGARLALSEHLQARALAPRPTEYVAMAAFAEAVEATGWRRALLAAWAAAYPRDPRPRWARVGLEIAAADFGAAEVALQEARKADPAAAAGAIAQAELVLARLDGGEPRAADEAAAALGALSTVAAARPEHAKALWLAALLHLARGDVARMLDAADAHLDAAADASLMASRASRLRRLWLGGAAVARRRKDLGLEAACLRRVARFEPYDRDVAAALAVVEGLLASPPPSSPGR